MFHSLVQLLKGYLRDIMGVYVENIKVYHCLCSQPGYKGKYYFSPTQISVAIGYGASV